ncbi:hypothetical protein GCM10027431_32640 [Lysobacter rhizosphaerae]
MVNARVTFGLLVAAIAAASIAYFAVERRADAPPLDVEATAAETAKSGGGAQSSFGERPQTATKAAQQPDLFAVASSLEARSRSGEGQASREIAKIYEDCWLYAKNPAGFESDAQTLAKLQPKTAAKRLSAARIVMNRCHGFAGANIGPEAVAEYRALAMRQGDLAAEVEKFAQGAMVGNASTDEVKLTVDEVMASRDPDAFAAMASLMGPAGVEYQENLSPIPAGSLLAEAAWNVAACRLGRPCGPDSAAVLRMCVGGGINCELRDVKSFYVQEMLPPADAEKLEQLVNSLVQGAKK